MLVDPSSCPLPLGALPWRQGANAYGDRGSDLARNADSVVRVKIQVLVLAPLG